MMEENKIIDNRYEIECFIQAQMCNPNGDPAMGNLPRQDIDTERGIITDVAIKRRIRDYVLSNFHDEGEDILVKPGESLNKDIAKIVLSAAKVDNKKNISKNFDQKEATDEACRRYWDVRTFGAVLSTGMNAGQVQGAVQIGMSTSLDPIAIEDMTITRMAYADAKDKNTVEEYEQEEQEHDPKKRRTMGNKQYTPYGLYKVKITVSANLAHKVGFTEKDLDIFLEALMQSYSSITSSSKMGMEVLSPIIVFKHVGTQPDETNSEQAKRERLCGCAPAYKLFDLIDIHKKEGIKYPRKYSDYEASLNLNEVPKGVQVGFKTNPFGEIEWTPNDDEWIQITPLNNNEK